MTEEQLELEVSGDVEGCEFPFSVTTRSRLGGMSNSRVYSLLYKGRTRFESVYAHHSTTLPPPTREKA